MKAQLLSHGDHRRREDGVCAMEMVAWLAGEEHSDHPECACPALTAFTVRLNDAHWPGGDVQRTEVLGPVLPLLVGSRSTSAVYRRRGYYLSDRTVRELVPMALESRAMNRPPKAAALLREVAKTLRSVPAIVDKASASVARVGTRDLRDALSKLREGLLADDAAADADVAAYAVAVAAAADAYAAADAAAEDVAAAIVAAVADADVADADADAAARAANTVYDASNAANDAYAAAAAAASAVVDAADFSQAADATADNRLPVLRRAAEILAEAARITEVLS